MKRYIAELVGTFIMIFIGCGAIIVSQLYPDTVNHTGIALAFGCAVMVVIYSVGNVSGAHLNPAVTIAFTAAGRFDKRDILPYISAQLTGAFTAVLFLKLFFLSESSGVTKPSKTELNALFIEVILTFILMTVILNISSGYKEKGLMAGVAVGFTVFLGALVGGPLTGASMNPARSLAPALLDLNFTAIWVYIAGPATGALLAVPVFKIIQSGEPDSGC